MAKEKQRKQIHITDFDLRRLEKLIGEARMKNSRDGKHLHELEAELSKAVVVDSKEIPLDVVTMNSQVVLVDLDSGNEVTLTLSFPADANAEEGRISVLAPIGTAIIGYRKGDVVEWEVPAGKRRLRVKELLYQPESAGDYDL
jgi:regulator of nucleoside diphosphate kinase